MIIGYTAGVYDLFHAGHLNILKKAKSECDYLIVGVNTASGTSNYKNKTPIISDADRVEIVRNIKCVDEAHLVETNDKLEALKKFNYDVIFVGDDHKGEPTWVELEETLAKLGKRVEYFPYTKGVSTTEILKKIRSTQ